MNLQKFLREEVLTLRARVEVLDKKSFRSVFQYLKARSRLRRRRLLQQSAEAIRR